VLNVPHHRLSEPVTVMWYSFVKPWCIYCTRMECVSRQPRQGWWGLIHATLDWSIQYMLFKLYLVVQM